MSKELDGCAGSLLKAILGIIVGIVGAVLVNTLELSRDGFAYWALLALFGFVGGALYWSK